MGTTSPGTTFAVQGNALISGTLTISPAASTNMGLAISQTGPSSGTQVGPFYYNQLVTTNDQYAVTHPSSPFLANTLGFASILNTGGTNSEGTKTAFMANINHTAGSDPVDGRDTVAATFYATSIASEGGTGTGVSTAKGTLFATNPYVQLSAPNYFTVSGGEIDVFIESGGSAYSRFGLSYVDGGVAQAASLYDAAIEIAATGLGWKNGILFSKLHGSAPVSSSGTLIGTDAIAATVANGIDFSPYTFTGYFLKGPNNFVVTGAGGVGIGTTTPGTALEVISSDNVTPVSTSGGVRVRSQNLSQTMTYDWGGMYGSYYTAFNTVGDGTNAFFFQVSNADVMRILSNGNVGIGTTTPWKTLGVGGELGVSSHVYFTGLTGAFGSGSLCLNSSGEVLYNSGSDSCTSSLRATKHDITPLAFDGLAIVDSLDPVSFIYNGSDGRTRYGFIAEDAAAVDVHLATYNASSSMSGIDDRALLSVLVKAVQEIASLTDAFKTKLVAWFADATNGIGDFFAKVIHSEKVQTAELCVGDTCITEEQLGAMLSAAGASALPPAPPADEPATSTLPDGGAASVPVNEEATTSSSPGQASSTPEGVAPEPSALEADAIPEPEPAATSEAGPAAEIPQPPQAEPTAAPDGEVL